MSTIVKKCLTLFIVVLLLATFGAFALGSGDSGDADQGVETVDKTKDTSNKSNAENVDTTQTQNNSKLGNCSVEIKSCRLAKNYEGKPVIIVKYLYTNEDDEPKAFMWSVEDKLYQDGVGLNKAYVLSDSVNYSDDNQSKEVKKGTTLEVEVAYLLNDTTTDVEVEVSEYLGWSDKKITKTFKLS